METSITQHIDTVRCY